MYKLTTSGAIVVRTADGAYIPDDPRNADRIRYLLWLVAGNTPIPADIPDPKLAILADIDQRERAAMLPRVSREFMLGYMTATFTAQQLTKNPGYINLKAFDDQIVALRQATK